ncbi:MAG: HipA domain-containing protein [Alteromonadaceae bacterium]|nr:HipA domain-containing protein [Alteromonadaceae bacterium]
MNCLICLKALPKHSGPHYHSGCLEQLFGTRKIDLNLPQTRQDLVTSMPRKTHGFSISGVQMKCQMAIEKEQLKLVDHGGEFIMKPSPEEYPYVAENEHTSLTLMKQLGFEVPDCGLLQLNDGHLVFIIRRYDRDLATGAKIHQEDAMQALGIANIGTDQKYQSSSYEQVLVLAIEHAGLAVGMELFLRLAFSYLVGNDDHHLKNISFFHDPVFKLTPCYDVLASSLYSSKADSPMALKFFQTGEPTYFREMGNGFYAGSDFIELANKVGLPEKVARKRLHNLTNKMEKAAPDTITSSHMPTDMKARYQELVTQRIQFMRVV